MGEKMITLHNKDCMRGMKDFPDGFFEWAIVDPPYGAVEMMVSGGGTNRLRERMPWDVRPSREYFEELFRVSKNQIIWGGNYFSDFLPISNSWLCWHKGKQLNFPEFELAWTSTKKPSGYFYFSRADANINKVKIKFHPTQKPRELYVWIMSRFCTPGDRILDTHLGGGSIALAAHDMKLALWGYEISEDYYNKAVKRLDLHRQQLKLF